MRLKVSQFLSKSRATPDPPLHIVWFPFRVDEIISLSGVTERTAAAAFLVQVMPLQIGSHCSVGVKTDPGSVEPCMCLSF